MEVSVILSFIIIYLFAPSQYRLRSAFYLFCACLVGSVCFICGWHVGWGIILFLVKIPVFPFTYWLPEVHVEASTGFSILLAAVVLKLGIHGFVRYVNCGWHPLLVCSCLIGMAHSCSSLFRSLDLKRSVAITSIVHLNGSLLMAMSLTMSGVFGCVLTSLHHSISAGSTFFIIGAGINRTGCRSIESLYLWSHTARSILLINFLTLCSWPGTLGFVGECTGLLSVPISPAVIFANSICLGALWMLCLKRSKLLRTWNISLLESTMSLVGPFLLVLSGLLEITW